MIEIKVDTRALEALFNQLAARTSNTRPAMVAISEMLFDSVEENFKVGGRPSWQPLSEARIKQRSKKHKVHGVTKRPTWPGDILVEAGLQGGLQGKMSRRADNTTAIVGNNAEYAAAMQLGRPDKNIPARPFLAIQPEDIKEAEAILLQHLLK